MSHRAYNANLIASTEEIMNPAKSKCLRNIVTYNRESPSETMVLLAMRYFDTLPEDDYISNKTTIIKCNPIPQEKRIVGFEKYLLEEGSQVLNYLLEKFDYSQNAAINVLNAAEARINF